MPTITVIEDHVLFERDGYQLVMKTIGDNDCFELQYRFSDNHLIDYTLDRLFTEMSIDDLEIFAARLVEFFQAD